MINELSAQDEDGGDEMRFDPVELQHEIIQAFSHFTYVFTRRKMLVCDLQGVLDVSCSPPCFELTDPVIHYTSRSGEFIVKLVAETRISRVFSI